MSNELKKRNIPLILAKMGLSENGKKQNYLEGIMAAP